MLLEILSDKSSRHDALDETKRALANDLVCVHSHNHLVRHDGEFGIADELIMMGNVAKDVQSIDSQIREESLERVKSIKESISGTDNSCVNVQMAERLLCLLIVQKKTEYLLRTIQELNLISLAESRFREHGIRKPATKVPVEQPAA